jgi:hypothetical protein
MFDWFELNSDRCGNAILLGKSAFPSRQKREISAGSLGHLELTSQGSQA